MRIIVRLSFGHFLDPGFLYSWMSPHFGQRYRYVLAVAAVGVLGGLARDAGDARHIAVARMMVVDFIPGTVIILGLESSGEVGEED